MAQQYADQHLKGDHVQGVVGPKLWQVSAHTSKVEALS
jgi:hypothetical protein